MSSLPQDLQLNSPSCAPYDTFMALKADHSIRLPTCLNSLIQSITTPLFEIHASINVAEQVPPSPIESTLFLAHQIPEVDPKVTLKQAISQLLNILTLLDIDILRPMHKLSISLEDIRRRIHILHHGGRAPSNPIELKRLCEKLKQSTFLVRTLRKKLPSFRGNLKAFIYWTDNELMATLASSIHILEQSVTKPEIANANGDVGDRFISLIDHCVDIVHSSWLLTGRLRRMQHRCQALIQPLESLSVQASARRSFVLNSMASRSVKARTGRTIQGGRVGNTLERCLSSLSPLHITINPACSTTIRNLIERLESLT